MRGLQEATTSRPLGAIKLHRAPTGARALRITTRASIVASLCLTPQPQTSFAYTTTDTQHAQMPAFHLRNCKYFDSDGTTRLRDSTIDSPRHISPGLRGDGRSMTKVEATLRQKHDLQIIVNS